MTLFLSGQIPDADELNDEIVDPLAAAKASITNAEAAWQTYTPTLANLTLGNGTVAASYRRVGKTLWLRFRFTFGSTSAMGTNPTFSLPAAMTALYPSDLAGDCYLQDTGASTRRGLAILASGTTIGIFNFSTTGILQGTTATVPHTWANTDIIFMNSYAIELT